MRLGVVGCGYWGSKHLRVLQSLHGLDFVMAIDPRAERLSAITLTFPTIATCPDLRSALPEVDAVIIATPPSSHFQLALQALEADRHVLVEKPLATSVKHVRRLIDVAESGSLTLMVGHTFEYNAAVWKLRDLIQSGELGHVHYVDTARLNLGLYQTDVDVLWDLAAHDVSITNYLLGSQPDLVSAWGSSHAHVRLVDVAYLSLSYSAIGVTAQIHVSWLDPCKVRRVTVVGSQKMAVYNDLTDDERIRIYDKGVTMAPAGSDLHDPPLTYRYGGIVSPYIEFHEPLAVEDAHFVDCILTQRRPQSDGYSGLRVVEVLEASQRALREGRVIPLESKIPSSI